MNAGGARIDLALAPPGADGRVRFSGDFVLLKPVDPKANATAKRLNRKRKGIDAHAIHGDMYQNKRNRVMSKFRKGELSVRIASFELLAKSLRPLPDKFHGLQDVEARFRQRYLDLLVNEDARRIALLRSRTLRASLQPASARAASSTVSVASGI